MAHLMCMPYVTSVCVGISFIYFSAERSFHSGQTVGTVTHSDINYVNVKLVLFRMYISDLRQQ